MDRIIRKMQDIEDRINYFAAVMACLTFGFMSVIVIIQVISRSFMGYSFQWAEEMARYFFIWSTMLAATCALHSHVHIGVDVLVNNLKGGTRRGVQIMAYIFLLFAIFVLVYFGGEQAFLAHQSGQTATSFPVSAGLLFLSIPFNGVLMFFICVTQLLELVFFGENREVGIAPDSWA